MAHEFSTLLEHCKTTKSSLMIQWFTGSSNWKLRKNSLSPKPVSQTGPQTSLRERNINLWMGSQLLPHGIKLNCYRLYVEKALTHNYFHVFLHAI